VLGRIYKICHLDALRCHDIHAKLHKDWFWHSKVDWGYTHTQQSYLISLLLFFFKGKQAKNIPSEKYFLKKYP
jgi:hypothetical protein